MMVEEAFTVQDSLQNFIDIMHRVHCDNSKQQYIVKRPPNHEFSTMPLTPFVYEFFIFNSIYQINWDTSLKQKRLIPLRNNFTESKKQRKLLKFLKKFAKENPASLYRAFEPFQYLPEIEGDWIEVRNGSRISREHGKSFFENVRKMKKAIESCNDPEQMPVSNQIFNIVEKGTYFIYLVRNNIFHGSKRLGNIYETNQKRRIYVYELFLKAITSLFFLAVDKSPVASDFIPCPIFGNALALALNEEVLDLDTVWTAINKGFMKFSDPRLISQFTKLIPPPAEPNPSEKGALFYPSAGNDLITPLILGLPYCRHFYFFDAGGHWDIPRLNQVLKKMRIISFRPRPRGPREDQHLDFCFNNIPRRVHLVKADNMKFLDYDVELAFYFHRGDSWGEGGSGQRWDSKLLPELIKKVPANKKCIFITDGEPGGLEKKYCESCFTSLSIPFIERRRTYYIGYLRDFDEWFSSYLQL